jgi:hypothetical protein
LIAIANSHYFKVKDVVRWQLAVRPLLLRLACCSAACACAYLTFQFSLVCNSQTGYQKWNANTICSGSYLLFVTWVWVFDFKFEHLVSESESDQSW